MGKSSGRKRKISVETASGQKATGASLHPYDPRLSPQRSVISKTYYRYILAASVSLITLAVYLTSLRNGFVSWDDQQYVYENPFIHSLNLAFFKWAFLDFHAGNWHPLTWISHALDYALWGLNPIGHHLTNNILHGVNTFIVVVVVTRLVEARTVSARKEGSSGFLNDEMALVTGLVTGLLFGLHPLHVESVAWVSERKDLLCALFFLLGIAAYTEYVHKSVGSGFQGRPTSFFSDRRYLVVIVFFVLALLSKPMAVTFPIVLLILDWYPFGRLRSFSTVRSAVVEKLPFIALSLVSSILTVLAQSSSGTIGNAPLSMRMLVAVDSLTAYLWKMILPVNLMPFYPFPRRESFAPSDYYLAVVLVVGILATCLVLVKRRRLWMAVWCYYVATLLPVLGLVEVGLQSRADRYTYLPGLGPFLVVGLGAAWVYWKSSTLTRLGKAARVAGIAAGIIVVGYMSYLTVEQIGIWKNGLALWNYQIRKEQEKVPLAYMNRGMAYEERGQLDKAIADMEEAIRLNPSFISAVLHIRLGILYGKTGSLEKAIVQFGKAIELNPRYSLPYNNRGYAYLLSAQYEKALRDFDNAIQLNKTDAVAYFNRGNLYLKIGNDKLAISDFQKACDLKNEESCKALRTLRKSRANQEKAQELYATNSESSQSSR